MSKPIFLKKKNKTEKNMSKCRLLKFLPSMLSINKQYMSCNIIKGTSRHVHPVMIQINLPICAVWSGSSLGTFWTAKDAKFLPADNWDSDQTAQMHRLIRVFIEHTCQKVPFLTLQPINIFIYFKQRKNILSSCFQSLIHYLVIESTNIHCGTVIWICFYI